MDAVEEKLEGSRGVDSFTESARTSEKGTKSPMSLMLTGLLQKIELISAPDGPSIDLVEDLLAIVRKHDRK